MAWGKNGTPHTLSGTADAVTISDLTANKFNVFMTHIIASGSCWTDSRINNDSGSLYAQRRSANGAADTTLTSQALLLQTSWSLTTEAFIITYVVGISGKEKLAIGFAVETRSPPIK